MISLEFVSMQEAERSQQQLIKEAEFYRQAYKGLDDRQSRSHSVAQFLARIGKYLATLGSGMEKRYGGEAALGVVFDVPINPDESR